MGNAGTMNDQQPKKAARKKIVEKHRPPHDLRLAWVDLTNRKYRTRDVIVIKGATTWRPTDID